MGGRAWEKQELEDLDRMWWGSPRSAIISAIPNRTYAAIYRMAQVRNLRRRSDLRFEPKKNIPHILVLLRRQREGKGWSRDDLAVKISGFSKRKIAERETGQYYPRFRDLLKWCDALGVELALVPKRFR